MKSYRTIKCGLLAIQAVLCLTSQTVQAGCRDRYNDFVFQMQQNIDSRGTKGAVIGAAAAPAVLEAFNLRPGNVGLGVAMATGIVAVGGGAAVYYWNQADQAAWVNQLLEDSRKGDGSALHEAALKVGMSPSDVSQMVMALDATDAFCKDRKVLLKDEVLSLLTPVSSGD